MSWLGCSTAMALAAWSAAANGYITPLMATA